MEIRLIQSKSALHKSKLAGGGYTLNPYSGCQHGCQYCYNQRFFNIIHPDCPWGKYFDIKENFPEILAKEILTKPKATAFFSTITDSYNSLEKKYQLTRRSLELLLANGWRVSVLTKSDLVLRDLDLFIKYRSKVDIGFTITSLDDKIAKIFEPGAPLPSRRLAALKKLNEYKIKNYIFVAPIIPQITDLEKIIETTHKYCQELWFDSLNTKLINWSAWLNIIKQYFPNLLNFYQKYPQDKKLFEEEIIIKIKKLVQKYKIKTKIIF
jgi:DNA repair photolyase